MATTGRVITVTLLALIGGVLAFIVPLAAIPVLVLAVTIGAWFSRPAAAPAGPVGSTVLPAVIAASGGGTGWLISGFVFGILGGGTPAPKVPITNPLDPAQRSAVLAYAKDLEFADTLCTSHTQHAPGSYHGECDRNLVDTLGTVAIVSPEEHAHRTRSAALRRGRIQLRVEVRVSRLDLSPQQVYDEIGLYPGVSYFWVDSLAVQSGDSTTARAVIVPADSRFPVTFKAIRVYPGKTWNLAVARWTPGQCWSCMKGQWCSNP
jgi:hypothetical protein